MASLPPPPSPTHILRIHGAPVSTLWISHDNERLYSGDSSGVVFITSTRSLRPMTSWKAHTDSLLGVEEWGSRIITHGRDNKLHVWGRPAEEENASSRSIRPGGSAAALKNPEPALCYSMDVNALNFCRFSLMKVHDTSRPSSSSSSSREEERALIALPNLIDSNAADIWSLPDRDRLHAAIGQVDVPPPSGGVRNTTGVIMSLHVFCHRSEIQEPTASSSGYSNDELKILCSYENGSVALRKYTRADKLKSVEGRGWDTIWNVKLHTETIMGMCVSIDNQLALSVSADNLVGRYDLSGSRSVEESCQSFRTKHSGNGCVAIRDDGRVCAVGGWDGRVRLFSVKSMKPLGTLSYHKSNIQALEFARFSTEQSLTSDLSDDEDFNESDSAARERWLIPGGKDSRVTIWSLITFERV
ncbi:WD-40 repeat-containing protein [Pluteus cervinus]|uniref:WD-40 repeat-containing protein n=1 Tax=Pluteus cervinus TaxID=181527 RepID=A0ACD3B4I1_9AGAR|nr:WD-40 repeat-containing protein [Pluteus cervinus]